MSRALGQEAEDLALQFLQSQGLVFVERNYGCPWGEIDLIMRDGDVLGMIEVKMRSEDSLIDGYEALDRRKVGRLGKAALCFLDEKDWRDVMVRFDLLVITRRDQEVEYDWIPNAFEIEGFSSY